MWPCVRVSDRRRGRGCRIAVNLFLLCCNPDKKFQQPMLQFVNWNQIAGSSHSVARRTPWHTVAHRRTPLQRPYTRTPPSLPEGFSHRKTNFAVPEQSCFCWVILRDEKRGPQRSVAALGAASCQLSRSFRTLT